MKVVTGSQMAEIDKKTIQEYGVLSLILMENAARAVCRTLIEQTGNLRPPVAVLCSSGNNGGDGFCAARILKTWGFPVNLVHVGRSQTLKPDAEKNYKLARKYGLDVIQVREERELDKLVEAVDRSQWVIDALFGTGLSSPVRGIAAAALKKVSPMGKKCIAIDLPSGINSDTGEVLGDVIPADYTVTFGLPKWGHFIFPGAEFVGKLVVADIGFPSELINDPALKAELIPPEMVRQAVSPLPANSHKTTRGKLGVVGGSRNLLGAAIMTAQAALRTGSGYVQLYLPNFLEPTAKAAAPELVTRGLPDMNGGYLCSEATDMILQLLEKETAIAFGPGIGTLPFTRGFVLDFLEENKLPMVIDADGLNNLAKEENFTRNPEVPWILTPHPGEAARLLKTSTSEILKDPLGSLGEMVEKYQAVVLLKGANTLIMNTDGRIYINTTGNPVLSVIGTGDLLTGIIGSLLARGVEPFEAAAAGAYIHGLTGDLAAKLLAPEGITPPDMLTLIPEALQLIREEEPVEKVQVLL